jgi:hypothetical protein
MAKTKLTKLAHTRLTAEDLEKLLVLADQRQQTVSQIIRKALIDQCLIRNQP